MPADVVAAGLRLPWAARAQDAVEALDWAFTERARLRRPAVRWWWGRRSSAFGQAAVCYLCGATIATWSGRFPMTSGARARILAHREVEAGC